MSPRNDDTTVVATAVVKGSTTTVSQVTASFRPSDQNLNVKAVISSTHGKVTATLNNDATKAALARLESSEVIGVR